MISQKSLSSEPDNQQQQQMIDATAVNRRSFGDLQTNRDFNTLTFKRTVPHLQVIFQVQSSPHNMEQRQR